MSWNIQDYEPSFRFRSNTNLTWGAGGNTLVITDPKIVKNSQVEIWVTGTTPAAGNWAYSYSEGSVTITSSSSESSTLALSYYIS